MGSLIKHEILPKMDDKSKKILSTGTSVGTAIISLLGGLALLVWSLKNVDLKLHLVVGY